MSMDRASFGSGSKKGSVGDGVRKISTGSTSNKGSVGGASAGRKVSGESAEQRQRQFSQGEEIGEDGQEIPMPEEQLSPLGSNKSFRMSIQEGDEEEMEVPAEADANENEYLGEVDVTYEAPECDCNDEDCQCETPPDEEEKEKEPSEDEPDEVFQLDEFMRAKSYFLNTSSKSGLNLYDHLSDVIRKFLDERAPSNPVDYLEEVSMNLKRYRFGELKKDNLQDVFQISEPVLTGAQNILSLYKNFARWSESGKSEVAGEGGPFAGGSFQNLLRLQYYLEHVNIGLPREEMFHLAIEIRGFLEQRQYLSRCRFWGKIFGTQKNYFVVEAETKAGGSDQYQQDLWAPGEDDAPTSATAIKAGEGETEVAGGGEAGGKEKENVPDALQTFSRAKGVVLNPDILSAYSKTSGLPSDKKKDLLPKPVSIVMSSQNPDELDGEDQSQQQNDDPIEFEDPEALADATTWEGYQQELAENFPQAAAVQESETVEVPMEEIGTGVNRRLFYVCNELGEDWVLLPAITPQQLNGSRTIRWCPTGNLNSQVKNVQTYPGKEGHYLKALIARITAGAMVSPKGYYKSKVSDEEDDDSEPEPEDDDLTASADDKLRPVKKYEVSIQAVIDPNMEIWVHHTAHILPQGRIVWWNPAAGKKNEESDDEDVDEEDDELDSEGSPEKEFSPLLLRSITEDVAPDGRSPWCLTTSSSIFQEFQVVCVRSNTWPGSNVICTKKGKVANVYLGDGQKFAPATYAPYISGASQMEFRAGPELQEMADPTVEKEQSWLDKLAVNEIAEEDEGEGAEYDN